MTIEYVKESHHESRLYRANRTARKHYLRRSTHSPAAGGPGAGEGRRGRGEPGRYLYPQRCQLLGAAPALHHRLRPGGSGRSGRRGRRALSSGRPRLGNQPRVARPSRNVCRILRRRRAMALSNARRCQRHDRGGSGAGRGDGPPGAIPRGAAARRRDGFRAWREWRRGRDGCANGQGGRCARHHHRR